MSDSTRHTMKGKRDPGCRRVRRMLPALLTDDLSGGSRETVEAHLAVCPACSAERDALRETYRALESRALPQPDPRLWDDLHRNVRLRLAEDSVPSGRRPRIPMRTWAPVAAAASLALLLWWASPLRSPDPDGEALLPRLEMAGWQSLSALGEDAVSLDLIADNPAASVDDLLGELSEAQLERLAARLEDLLG